MSEASPTKKGLLTSENYNLFNNTFALTHVDYDRFVCIGKWDLFFPTKVDLVGGIWNREKVHDIILLQSGSNFYDNQSIYNVLWAKERIRKKGDLYYFLLRRFENISFNSVTVSCKIGSVTTDESGMQEVPFK